MPLHALLFNSLTFQTYLKTFSFSNPPSPMAGLKLICGLVLLCMLVVEPMATTALTCGQVASQTAGCIRYLQRGGNPPAACCNGVRNLNRQARTTRDRQTACRCLQTAARTISGINAKLAAGLPAKCGVKIPYKISPSTNCNRVR